MKKTLLLTLMFLATLSSCGNVSLSANSGSVTPSKSQAPALEPIEIYTDSTTQHIDVFAIENIRRKCEKTSDNQYRLELSLTFSCSRSYRSYLNVERSSIRTINDVTNEKYQTEVSGWFMSKNEYDTFDSAAINNSLVMPTSYSYDFKANIPTDINDEKYTITLVANNRTVNIHLYKTPEDKKQTWTVTYKVSSKTVKTIEVKDNERIKEKFTYEFPDHLSYVDDYHWYKDGSFRERWDNNIQIRSNITLYGAKSDNWDFSPEPTPEFYEKITGIAHFPSDHVLVLPISHANRDVVLGENVIAKYERIEKIYIPKTVHAIYSGNFKLPNTPEIYYEGTESQWRSIFVDQSGIYLTNVRYNTKSPY